jgi:hypothetical protein
MGGRWPEVGGGPDGWAPSVCEREGEGLGRWRWAVRGPEANWAATVKKRREGAGPRWRNGLEG